MDFRFSSGFWRRNAAVGRLSGSLTRSAPQAAERRCVPTVKLGLIPHVCSSVCLRTGIRVLEPTPGCSCESFCTTEPEMARDGLLQALTVSQNAALIEERLLLQPGGTGGLNGRRCFTRRRSSRRASGIPLDKAAALRRLAPAGGGWRGAAAT